MRPLYTQYLDTSVRRKMVKNKKIWLVHAGELFPIDSNYRPFRYEELATHLINNGWHVQRWALDFNHFEKKTRNINKCISIRDSYDCDFIWTPSYRENKSLRRILAYVVSGFMSLARMASRARPKIAILSFPSIELAFAAALILKMRKVPYIFDVRDLWPDIFYSELTGFKLAITKTLCFPWEMQVRFIAKNALCITAVSNDYLKWGVGKAKREMSEADHVFYLGYSKIKKNAATTKRHIVHPISKQEIRVQDDEVCCCYLGQFADSYDINCLVQSIKLVMGEFQKVRFFLCGDGSKLKDVVAELEAIPQVHVFGWVNEEILTQVLSISDIGLAPYRLGALQSIPNKPIEYLGANLAIVSSLQGEFYDIVERHKLGINYSAGDHRAMAKAISRLIRNEPYRKACQENAGKFFNENFEAQKLYPSFVDFIECKI